MDTSWTNASRVWSDRRTLPLPTVVSANVCATACVMFTGMVVLALIDRDTASRVTTTTTSLGMYAQVVHVRHVGVPLEGVASRSTYAPAPHVLFVRHSRSVVVVGGTSSGAQMVVVMHVRRVWSKYSLEEQLAHTASLVGVLGTTVSALYAAHSTARVHAVTSVSVSVW